MAPQAHAGRGRGRAEGPSDQEGPQADHRGGDRGHPLLPKLLWTAPINPIRATVVAPSSSQNLPHGPGNLRGSVSRFTQIGIVVSKM